VQARGHRSWVLAILAAGCVSAQRTPERSIGTAAGPSSATPEPARSPFRLSISGNRVSLDGQPVAELTPGKVERIDVLLRALKGRTPSPQRYELSIGDDVDGAEFKSVVYTSAFAGFPAAKVQTTAGDVGVSAVVSYPMPAAVDASPMPHDSLILVARPTVVELWRAKDPTPEAIASVQPDNLASAMQLECRHGRCDRLVLVVASETKFAALRTTLKVVAAVRSAPGVEPEAQLRLDAPAEGTPPKVRIGATLVSGRLRPELIQRTVRANFGKFRLCYEAGLARDPKLTGKVGVRFVIGRDGHVSDSSSDPSTDLPDGAVVDCVLQAFHELVFPEPEGGIVTVVYPIMFSPST
jgi:hypothetical protein